MPSLELTRLYKFLRISRLSAIVNRLTSIIFLLFKMKRKRRKVLSKWQIYQLLVEQELDIIKEQIKMDSLVPEMILLKNNFLNLKVKIAKV